MNFLVDEGVDRQIVDKLRQDDHSVLYIAEMAPGIADDEVLEMANERGALLLTSDKDFGELVFRNGQLHGGIVLLRLQDESSANRVQAIRAVLERYADRLAGCFTVATDRGVRIRRF